MIERVGRSVPSGRLYIESQPPTVEQCRQQARELRQRYEQFGDALPRAGYAAFINQVFEEKIRQDRAAPFETEGKDRKAIRARLQFNRIDRAAMRDMRARQQQKVEETRAAVNVESARNWLVEAEAHQKRCREIDPLSSRTLVEKIANVQKELKRMGEVTFDRFSQTGQQPRWLTPVMLAGAIVVAIVTRKAQPLTKLV